MGEVLLYHGPNRNEHAHSLKQANVVLSSYSVVEVPAFILVSSCNLLMNFRDFSSEIIPSMLASVFKNASLELI